MPAKTLQQNPRNHRTKATRQAGATRTDRQPPHGASQKARAGPASPSGGLQKRSPTANPFCTPTSKAVTRFSPPSRSKAFRNSARPWQQARTAIRRGNAIEAVAGAYMHFATSSPALYEVMFSLRLSVAFGESKTPPELKFAFSPSSWSYSRTRAQSRRADPGFSPATACSPKSCPSCSGQAFTE